MQHGKLTVGRLQRSVSIAGLVLLAVTWKLWTPQTVFPQIPMVGWAGDVPLWCDWVGFAVMTASLAIAAAGPSSIHWNRGALIVFVFVFAVMVAIDQHRLQPWAYQFALIALVLSIAPSERVLPLIRVLTISIYFHSALSKIDLSFFDTHGQYLVSGLTDISGILFRNWEPTTRLAIAACLPIGELIVAIGLCMRRTRRPALIAAVVMHVLLIVALGPWSLNHEIGVLIWNVYFIVQNVLLFGGQSKKTTAETDRLLEKHVCVPGVEHREPPDRKIWAFASFNPGHPAAVVVGLAVLLPFLEPFGWFDVWPSWGLYASRPAKVTVLIESNVKDKLPADLAAHLHPQRFVDSLCPLRIERWSLETTNTPIYPQTRFQLGVALAIAERYKLGEQIFVEIESTADRWTGKRTSRKLSGIDDIRHEAKLFRLNALPRRTANAPE